MNFYFRAITLRPLQLALTVGLAILFYSGSAKACRGGVRGELSAQLGELQGDSALVVSDTVSRKSKSVSVRNIEFICEEAYSNDNNTVLKDEYDFDEFRFFGDVFRFHFPAFVNDFGSFGQPHEVNFYGLGAGNVSALYDGVPFESFHTGFADFHRFQINGISSVSLSSLPRGFLFGRTLNPVSVNFSSFEKFSQVAHTRIFYFQGANEEAMINIYFHEGITKKLFVTFDLANAMIEPEYRNSDYDTWNGSVKLTYLADSSFSASFLFSRYRAVTQLYGGVDVDSLWRQYGVNYEEYLYNGYLAPVMFPDRKMTTEWNNYVFTVKKNFSRKHKLQLKVSLADYNTRLTDKNFFQNPERNAYSTGFYELRDRYESDFFSAEAKISGNANFTRIIPGWFYDSHSLSLITSLKLLNGKLRPSFFGRILRQSGENYGGAGIDLTAKVTDSFSFYAGYSYYSKPYLPDVNEYLYFFDLPLVAPKITASEFGAYYKTEHVSFKATAFTFNNDAENYFYEKPDGTQGIDFAERQISGVHLNGSLRLGFLLLQFNYSHLNNVLKDLQVSPDNVINAGVYYYGRLFNGNLLMKSGVNFYYTGMQNYFYRDFYNARNIWFKESPASEIIPVSTSDASNDSFTFDFFFVGRIQDRANVYFIFENLLDRKYFIVPYYPKQSRGVRIGVSWDLYN